MVSLGLSDRWEVVVLVMDRRLANRMVQVWKSQRLKQRVRKGMTQ